MNKLALNNYLKTILLKCYPEKYKVKVKTVKKNCSF